MLRAVLRSRLGILRSVLICILCVPVVADAGLTCHSSLKTLFEGVSHWFGTVGPREKWLAEREIRIMEWNVENLFYHRGRFVQDPVTGKVLPDQELGPRQKPIAKLLAMARVINAENPHFMVLPEVEHDQMLLQKFSREFLNDRYRAMLFEGNDDRGITIGFLVRRDLPLELEYRSHRWEVWQDPAQNGSIEPVFKRDLPAMILRLRGESSESPPLGVILGAHFKSQRHRLGDFRGILQRGAEAERAHMIVEDYRGEFGSQVPIFLAGDFNANVAEELGFGPAPELAPLLKSEVLTEAFRLKKAFSWTHSYHPRQGPSQYLQLDSVFMTEPGARALKSIEVPAPLFADGTKMPVPKSYEERERQPSDHWPLLLRLDAERWLQESRRGAGDSSAPTVGPDP